MKLTFNQVWYNSGVDELFISRPVFNTPWYTFDNEMYSIFISNEFIDNSGYWHYIGEL